MNQPAATTLPAGAHRARRDFRPNTHFGPAAIAVMVLFHALVGYALVTGLGKRLVEVVKKPLEATIVQEVKLPPPPPPPPPKEVVKERPKAEVPPPPAYVPPPEVPRPAAVEPAPAITAVQSAVPEPPPPPAPAPAPPPAPPAPPPVVRAEIATACPKQVKPVMPQQAIDDGIEGTVRVEVRIKGGRVSDVRVLSGPKAYHAAVRAAVLHYECVGSDAEVIATQSFTFKFD